MTRGTDHEQHLITQVLSTITRLREQWETTSEADLLNLTFTKRRMAVMADTLAMAQEMIARLTDLLYGSEQNPVPVELRHARRARSSRLQPVRLEIGGVVRTIVVQPVGEDDPIGEARMWRRLNVRYGGEA